MNERIHRVLDGEIGVAELSPAERAELAAYETAIGASLRHAAAFEPAARDVSGRVMWRLGRMDVEQSGATRRAGPNAAAALGAAARWLITPRRFELRPAAMAASAVLLLAAGLATARLTPPAGGGADAGGVAGMTGVVPVADGQQRMLVQFRISAEGAQQVALVGDFSGWQSGYALEQVAPGVWWTTVALEPGIYDYAFVINGVTWKLDPLAPVVADGFGGANSRIAVLAPERVGRS